MSTSSIIEVKNVSQHFQVGFWLKKVQILQDLSVQIPTGSVFGLLGANGAGKTTLIHVLVGLRRPTMGEVLLSGKSATNPEARKNLGYLPERPYFHDFLTGEKLLRFMGTLSRMAPQEIEERIPKVLDAVKMSHAAHKELRTYSKGMLQRIGIAQALLSDPELIILDEPMSGLDPVGRREVRELIVELNSQGKTIFFSSHIVSDIELICDHVAILKGGHLMGAGKIMDFLKEEDLTDIVVQGISLEKVQEVLGGSLPGQETTEGILITVEDKTRVNEVLSDLVQEGARIYRVAPRLLGLERFF